MVLVLLRLYSSSDSDPPDIDWVAWSFAQTLRPSSNWRLFQERTGDERAPWLRRLPRPSAGIEVVVTSKLEEPNNPWSRPYFALCERETCALYCHELIHKLEVLHGTSPPVPSSFHSTIPACHPAMYGTISCPILATANNPSFPSSLHNYTYLLPSRFQSSPAMDNLYKQAAEALQPATPSPCTYALLHTSLVTFNPL